jgi:DNA topoisomerase-2
MEQVYEVSPSSEPSLLATTAPASGKYKKMTQIEHVYKLPDTYAGSCDNALNTMFMLSADKATLQSEDVTYPPALYKILDELIVNAADQRTRLQDPKLSTKYHVTTIDISVNRDTKEFTITNNGEGIDVEKTEYGVYAVELIFGNLLTSTNYEEGEERVVGGKNGLGSKICNIFSHRFTVTTVDYRRQLKYTQTFRNNMQVIEPPEITPFKGEPFTSVTMIPDLERFGLTEWSDTMFRVIEKRAYELTACLPGVKVSFNGNTVPIRNFEKFLDLVEEFKAGKVVEKLQPRWEIGVALSDGFKHISFVNGLSTHKGGKHVDYIANAIAKSVVELIEKKKKIKVKLSVVKDNLFVAVTCQIVNPTFDSQTKDTLTTPATKFGSKCDIPEKFIDKVLKLGLVDRVLALHEFKETKRVASQEGGKKKLRLYDIPKLDDANEAGSSKSSQCTLILTEGDSAKATAIAGLSVVGRDFFGVFPLKGKLLNVRDKQTTLAGRTQISNNDELNNIKRILGLETGKVYKTLSELRYGKVMIMTDQDVDGSHIKGLFINWIETCWPELIKLGFVTCLLTPIIKATKGSSVISFYSLGAFSEWQSTATGSWKIKYYKGLGTSTSAEAKEYFKELKQMLFVATEQSHDKIDMVFNNKRADDRKAWLRGYDFGKVLDNMLTEVPLEQFVDQEMIHFSNYDLKRSIGSVVDGLKPSQRKILFCCFKRNLKDEIKVAQLTGFVSENSGYHHGEESLNKTIVAMAQNFVGSNNIEFLQPVGQFGSRLEGGKDSASPRYIFTALDPVTEALFPVSDRPLLNYLEDDGQQVEPSFYVPILPTALINGVRGIGTGWSTNVPSFNPKDICQQFVERLQGRRDSFDNMRPFYNGFKGHMISLTETSFLSKGIYAVTSYNKIIISELPIETWTSDYKSFLDSMLIQDAEKEEGKKKKMSAKEAAYDGFLKGYKTNCTESIVHFELEVDPTILMEMSQNRGTEDPNVDVFEKVLKLTSKLSLTNMMLFDRNDIIQQYSSVSEIMEYFYGIRLEFYVKRKEYQIRTMEEELVMIRAKVRFIRGIVEETIVVYKKSTDQLTILLEELSFPKLKSSKTATTENYQYLLGMSIQSLTSDTLASLEKNLLVKEEDLETLKSKTIQEIWVDELLFFEKVYASSLEKKRVMYESELAGGSGGGTGSKSRGGGGTAAGKSKKK